MVVLFPPVLDVAGAKPRPGRGLVLDEQWAVASRFTAGASVDMIGACGGLLCLLDVRSHTIRISKPLTGESNSIDLPPPPRTGTRHDPRAYCLGFDAAAGRCKVVHVPHDDDDDDKSASSPAASTAKEPPVAYVLRVAHVRAAATLAATATARAPRRAHLLLEGASGWNTEHHAIQPIIRGRVTDQGTISIDTSFS